MHSSRVKALRCCCNDVCRTSRGQHAPYSPSTRNPRGRANATYNLGLDYMRAVLPEQVFRVAQLMPGCRWHLEGLLCEPFITPLHRLALGATRTYGSCSFRQRNVAKVSPIHAVRLFCLVSLQSLAHWHAPCGIHAGPQLMWRAPLTM
jgi:hypothetical protein